MSAETLRFTALEALPLMTGRSSAGGREVLQSFRPAFAGGIMTNVSAFTHKGKDDGIQSSHLGTWRLVSWENRSIVGGEVSYPLGKDAVGYIMYGQDGYMFVAIMRPDRVKFTAEDLFGGGAEERAQAAATYVSYCGRY